MFYENKELKSELSILIGLKNKQLVEKEYIQPKIASFFENQKKEHRNIKDYKELDYHFSDMDFKNPEVLKIDIFYTHFFNDIHRKGKVKNNEIDYSVKYLLTLDIENCTTKCEKTNIFYDKICLNTEPFFYFIYIDIADIFKFLRDKESNKPKAKNFSILQNLL